MISGGNAGENGKASIARETEPRRKEDASADSGMPIRQALPPQYGTNGSQAGNDFGVTGDTLSDRGGGAILVTAVPP
jgi:hypothetical protein